jgi:hypothetical protein
MWRISLIETPEEYEASKLIKPATSQNEKDNNKYSTPVLYYLMKYLYSYP